MTTSKKTALLASGAAMILALPAMAQDALCGGAGANGQWIGGDQAGSDVSTAGTYMEQMALVLLRNEYVALFDVTTPTSVRVEAEGRGGGDPVIDLRNAAGDIIVSDDDSGGNGASRAELDLEPGTYCLSMTSYDGSPMTGFVRVGTTDQEALTDGLGMADDGIEDVSDDIDPFAGLGATGAGCSDVQNFLADGQPVDGLLGSGISATASVEEVDAWGFTLSQSTPLSILAENPDADPVITLYDGAGNYLAENDDFDGLNSRIDMTAGLAAGDYCIEMRALTTDTLPITVSLEPYDAQAALQQSYDDGVASPPLDGSHPVTSLGALPPRLRQDVQSTSDNQWFSFEITQPELVIIETVSGSVGDSVLVMFDDFGREVAYNDDANGSLDSQIMTRVLPGTYLVGVRQLSDGQQAPLRLLFERFVPAAQ